MYKKSLMMYIYAETPLHPGSGSVISGVVDLPIQREKHTEFPMIQGSSLKGALRNQANSVNINDDDKKKIFGERDRIGGVSITDAKLLAFPVRSLKGLFGWITCPFILDRLKRDLEISGRTISWKIPDPSDDNKAIIKSDSNLINNNNIFLENLKLDAEESTELDNIISTIVEALPNNNVYQLIKGKLGKDVVVLTDDLFANLVSIAMEITTRTKIGEEGVVDEGPWSEEYIPTDTIMYCLILIPSRLEELKPEVITNKLKKYDNKIVNIGGNETIGKGFVRITLIDKGGNKNAEKSGAK